MSIPQKFPVSRAWRLLLRDLRIHPGNVLRRAGLPEDLFSRDGAEVDCEGYFRLFQALDDEAGDPELALKIGEQLSAEGFDPPVFAALCSPDLNVGLERIAKYKALICPLRLGLDLTEERTTLEIEWPSSMGEAPRLLVALELVFFVRLARLATRADIRPLNLTTPHPPEPAKAFTKFFGTRVTRGERHTIAFSAADARRPFLTANDTSWRFFEESLCRRLSELDEKATVADRVRAALLELLPSGQGTLHAVATKLGTSSRTLQRQLGVEDMPFQEVLNRTREQLARNYLKSSRMSGAEISFLLGYEDPGSFSRAFLTWTGTTPEQAREQMLNA